MSKLPLVLDFETRSPLDIREVGIYRYVEDPRTDVLCYAAKRGDLETYQLDDFGCIPTWVLDALADDRVELRAHNATVERLIIREIMGPRYGWPVPKGRRWRCSAARARRLALPGSLDKLGAALGLADELTKDKEGKNLIRRLSKPIKRTPEGFVYDNDPVKLDRFGQYCLQDVIAECAADEATLPMPPKEEDYYRLTERINDLGVRVDVPLIRRLVWRANEAVEELNSRLREITRGEVQALTQVAQLKAWVQRETGVELLTLRKEDMDGLVKEGTDRHLPGYVIEALKIRQEGAKSSVSKLLAILNRVSADGRVHGAFVYHGASTGRYTSMGVQLQNLVRDTLKDYEKEIQELEHFTLTQISKAIRGVFVPRKGHVFVDADYSAVEARGVAWLFDCKKLVDIFATGGDPYVEIACVIYERQISKDDADERWTGKQTILGCFAADTIVLTNNGPKSITRVHTNDLLWDGVEWVRHEGVAYQGHQTTETAHGLTATPGHEILTGRGWQAWHAVHTSPSLFRSALGSARSPSLAGNARKAGGFNLSAAVTAGGKVRSIGTTFDPVEPHGATPVQRKRVLGPIARLKATWQSFLTTHTVSGCSIEYPPFSAGATPQIAEPSNGTVPAEFRYTGYGTMTVLPCSNILQHFPAGMTRIWNWTVKIMTAIMSRAISVLSRGEKIGSTPVAVYDIVNSGPRHRFMVLTDAGWVIAHNCGYGMGPNKFAAQCEKFGKPVPMELAEKSVRSYREDYPEIPQGWRDMEHAAIQAVLHPGETFEIPNGKIAFRVHRGYLQMALPSGRRLFYKDPFIRHEDKFGTGRKRPVLWFWGINPKTKQWTPEKTWGGTLTENATQAFCRDLLFGAMKKLENDEIPVVMSIHDQVVCEVPKEDAEWAVHRVRQYMEKLPLWAVGFPIKAEPKITHRLGK